MLSYAETYREVPELTRVLLISDTHGNLEPARKIIETVKPDYILHLGDMQRDAKKLKAEYPDYTLDYVPGNCDMVTGPGCAAITAIDGCRILYTHGHEHHVKMSLMRLRLAALEAQVQIAAFGHTHRAYCEQIDGLWLVNPGSAQMHANYALIEIEAGTATCSLHTL